MVGSECDNCRYIYGCIIVLGCDVVIVKEAIFERDKDGHATLYYGRCRSRALSGQGRISVIYMLNSHE